MRLYLYSAIHMYMHSAMPLHYIPGYDLELPFNSILLHVIYMYIHVYNIVHGVYTYVWHCNIEARAFIAYYFIAYHQSE